MELFGGVEIVRVDRLAWFQPFDILELGDVEQDTTADNAVASHVDRASASAEASDFALAEAVIHLALPKDMAKCVQMGMSHSVRGNGEIVECRNPGRAGA